MKNQKKNRLLALALMVLFAMFAFTACGKDTTTTDTSAATTNTSRAKEIVIATKNTPEQNILANLAKILITEKTGQEGKIVYFDDSTSSSLLERLNNGSIDIFFDYSGSLAVNAFQLDIGATNVPTLLLDVQNTAKKKYGITVSEEIGYTSTTAFYMMSDRKEKLGISTISSLAKKASKLKVGMTEGFYNRIDCYEAICKEYEMTFKQAKTYDEEDGFMALADGTIDVFIDDSVTPYYSLFSKSQQLVDDKYFFLPQNACYLITDKTLEKYPELEDTLKQMEGLLTASKLSLMIKRIYWEGNDINDYLYTYLRANNII